MTCVRAISCIIIIFLSCYYYYFLVTLLLYSPFQAMPTFRIQSQTICHTTPIYIYI
eukprot:gene7411-5219_t